MFKQASKMKLRFATSKGNLSKYGVCILQEVFHFGFFQTSGNRIQESLS